MRVLIACLLFCVSFLNLKAQHPHDAIDTTNINLPFLEYLVKGKIDSLRKSKTFNALINDSILYMAAKEHADYMRKEAEISHYHKSDPNKKTPQKRAEFYGAKNYFVGENVALIYIYTPSYYAHERKSETHIVTSYDQAAHDFVVNWVNSRGHYANMLTESYEITAVAISFDPSEKALYAVQMFAEVDKSYELKKNDRLFPYDHISYDKLKKSLGAEIEAREKKSQNRFEFGLKRATKAHHCRGNTDRVFNSDLIQAYIGGDELGICTYDLARLKRFFRYRKDGLALEIIGFSEAYSCNESLLENEKKVLKGESLFTGKLTKPLYRNDIVKQIKAHEEEQKGRKRDRNRCFNIVLAKTPENFYTEQKEIKLVIIRKKRVCSIMSFRSLCGNLISYNVPELAPDFVIEEPSVFSPVLPEEKQFAKVKFDKNATAFESSVLDSLIQTLKRKDIQIQSLDIKAFASLEGDINDNKGLYQARAIGVLDALEHALGKKLKHTITAQENWTDFKRDISQNKEFRFLLNYDSTELRNYLNVEANAQRLENILANHRYTAVRLVYSPLLTAENMSMFAADEFNVKVLRNRKGKQLPEAVAMRLFKIQSFLFNRAMENGDKYYDSLLIPNEEKFFPFYLRNLQFNYLSGSMEDIDYFAELLRLKKRHKSELLERAYQAFLINNSGNEMYSEYLEPSLISALISDLKKGDGNEEMISELEVLYHFTRANDLYLKYGGRNLKRSAGSIKFLFNRFSANDSLNDRFRYSLARYFVLFYQFDYALKLLEKHALKANPNPYDLELYLKIIAIRDLESPSNEFRQLLLSAIDGLGEQRWCSLFVGQCNIPLDIFEFENILNLYCQTCRE